MEKATFRSQVNGLQFDSHNPTTNHLLGGHQKSQFVKTETMPKSKGGQKAKVSVGTDDNEQEIS
ncbi:hypothetical protein ACWIYZ_05005 [Ursidibacter arcticus]